MKLLVMMVLLFSLEGSEAKCDRTLCPKLPCRKGVSVRGQCCQTCSGGNKLKIKFM